MSFADVTFAVSSSSHSEAPIRVIFLDETWQYEETGRIIRSVSPRPGAPSICGVHGVGEALPQEPTRPLLFVRAARRALRCAPTQAQRPGDACFTGRVLKRITKRILGGSDGNEQLTAIVATLLLVLLAVEGATLLNMRSLLTVHAFVGVLLIPVVALKLGEHRLADAPLLPRRGRVRPARPAASLLASDRGASPRRVHDRPLRERRRPARARAARRSARRPAQGELPRLVRGDDGSRADQGAQVATRDPAALTGPRTSPRHRRCIARHGVTLATVSLPAVDHLQDSVSAHIGVDAQLDREIRPNRICRFHV